MEGLESPQEPPDGNRDRRQRGTSVALGVLAVVVLVVLVLLAFGATDALRP